MLRQLEYLGVDLGESLVALGYRHHRHLAPNVGLVKHVYLLTKPLRHDLWMKPRRESDLGSPGSRGERRQPSIRLQLRQCHSHASSLALCSCESRDAALGLRCFGTNEAHVHLVDL